MGSILAQAVIDRASVLLEDAAKATWTDQELLGWLNDGQLAIVGLRPDAKTRVRSVTLVAGTKQSIALPDLRVLDVTRNMGVGGNTPGRAIKFMDRGEMDLELPSWHAATADVVVRHWMYDQRVPGTWWCYPPQPPSGQGQAEVITSAVPTPATIANVDGATSSTAIDIDDIYVNPLVDFVVMRAFSKDSEYTQMGGKADLAARSFYNALGIKTETDKRFRPERSNPPKYNPPRVGNQGAFGEP
jgi:hypothetical protein